MTEIVYKISDKFTVSWDPEKITSMFPVIIQPESKFYFDPAGTPHWQMYQSTNILFGRNFSKNFKNECVEVSENLKIIQTRMQNDNTISANHLTDMFLNHRIQPERVNLLQTIPGKDIQLHKDVTRNICINIGIKNSNNWVTTISEDPDIRNFEKSKKHHFLMNDGDAYIILINNPHSATCLTPNDLNSTRLLITYNMSDAI